MKHRIETVAKAIWNAKPDDGSPKWEALDDVFDRGLKEEIRIMAKAAIKVCDQSNSPQK